jgi:5'-methylthioadenosine phosphorylase
VFLPRHGADHALLANEVNYRANVWGLHMLGVDRIVGTSAVGSLNPDIKVGDLVALDNLVDFTRHRRDTFNLGSVNFTEPYCKELRQTIINTAEKLNIDIHKSANYISTEGPRYETAAEIKMWRTLGMDVVGMTNATEATLARELGICYSVIAIVTNAAAGLSSIQPSLEIHKKIMQENSEKLRTLTLASIHEIIETHNCECRSWSAKPIRN